MYKLKPGKTKIISEIVFNIMELSIGLKNQNHLRNGIRSEFSPLPLHAHLG